MEIEIIRMEYDHLEQVLLMWKELLLLTEKVNARYKLSEEAFSVQRDFFIKQLNSETAYTFVSMYRDEPVGFTNGYLIMPSRVFRNNNIGLIENIYIKPEYRRKRIGEKLVKRCYNWFSKFNIEDVYVNVVPANQSSRRFWESMGYSVHKQTMALALKNIQ